MINIKLSIIIMLNIGSIFFGITNPFFKYVNIIKGNCKQHYLNSLFV